MWREPGRVGKALRFALAGVICAALTSENALAGDKVDKIKTAYLLNFARFAEWPNLSGSADVTLCISEKADFASAARSIGAREMGARRYVIRMIADPARFLDGCHIAFLDRRDLGSVDVAQLAARGSIAVGDSEGFAENGGAIGMIMVARKLRFEVNLNVIEKSRTRLSSKLLRLAVRVLQ